MGLVLMLVNISGRRRRPGVSVTDDLLTLPLVQAGDMDSTATGAFRYPYWTEFTGSGSTLGYAGPMAVDPTGNGGSGSIFIRGIETHSFVAEVTIPTIVNSANFDDLNLGSIIQTLVDPVNGQLVDINPGDPNQKAIGGLLPWGDRLIVAGYATYDGSATCVLSHWDRLKGDLTNHSGSNLKGLFKFQVPESHGGPVGAGPAGKWAGDMWPIPTAWQTLLGGKALMELNGVSVISRTNIGPAAFVFNPDDFATANPANNIDCFPLLCYPLGNGLDETNLANEYWSESSVTVCMGIPTGSRSLLYIGRHGRAKRCYGHAVSDVEDHETPQTPGDGELQCYDLEVGTKGPHNYYDGPSQTVLGYVVRVWAYDIADLIPIREGTADTWSATPYAIWDLECLVGSPKHGGSKLNFGGYFVPHATNGGKFYLNWPASDTPRYPASGWADSHPVCNVFDITL